MKTITLNNKTFNILRDTKRYTHYAILYKHYKKYDLSCVYNDWSSQKQEAYDYIVAKNKLRGVTSHVYILTASKNFFSTGHIELDDDGCKWLIVNTYANEYAILYPFND